MEPMYIRELVAWVLVCGLVVILASSKMKAKTKSSKSSPKKESKPVKTTVVTEEEEIPFLEMTPDESESVARLEKDLAEEAGSESRRVGSVPKTEGSERSERRGTDKMSGPSNKSPKVRSRKTAK